MNTETLIKDLTLRDSLGNEARITMHHLGGGDYEVYTSMMGSVPNRFEGPINLCMNHGEVWIAARKAQGFQEQLPSFTPCPIA